MEVAQHLALILSLKSITKLYNVAPTEVISREAPGVRPSFKLIGFVLPFHSVYRSIHYYTISLPSSDEDHVHLQRLQRLNLTVEGETKGSCLDGILI